MRSREEEGHTRMFRIGGPGSGNEYLEGQVEFIDEATASSCLLHHRYQRQIQGKTQGNSYLLP